MPVLSRSRKRPRRHAVADPGGLAARIGSSRALCASAAQLSGRQAGIGMQPNSLVSASDRYAVSQQEPSVDAAAGGTNCAALRRRLLGDRFSRPRRQAAVEAGHCEDRRSGKSAERSARTPGIVVATQRAGNRAPPCASGSSGSRWRCRGLQHRHRVSRRCARRLTIRMPETAPRAARP